MQSDKSAYYTYKYAPFVGGGMIILMMLVMHVFPENSTFNDNLDLPIFWCTKFYNPGANNIEVYHQTLRNSGSLDSDCHSLFDT
jgi:hypothetical protein